MANEFNQQNTSTNEAAFQSHIKDPTRSNTHLQLEHLKRIGFYARPTRFSFQIEGLREDVNTRLIRNCLSTTIPGRSLMSQAFKIYGNPMDQVYEVSYSNEISMTFRVGQDMFERDFFESWMNTAASYETADIEYPDNYMTRVKIYQLDPADYRVYCVRLNNVFCKTISDMELSSDSTDQIHTIQVTLSYSDYAVVGKIDPKEVNIAANTPEPTVKTNGRVAIYPGSKPQIDAQLQQPDWIKSLINFNN